MLVKTLVSTFPKTEKGHVDMHVSIAEFTGLYKAKGKEVRILKPFIRDGMLAQIVYVYLSRDEVLVHCYKWEG